MARRAAKKREKNESGQSQLGVRYRAVVVESSIVVEDVVEEGYYLGYITPDGIELTRERGLAPQTCVVSLKRE